MTTKNIKVKRKKNVPRKSDGQAYLKELIQLIMSVTNRTDFLEEEKKYR